MSRVLIFGGGGREAALAWKLSQSERVSEIVVAPGNPGMHRFRKTGTIPCPLRSSEMLSLAREFQPDLIIIGPEQPLVDGAADLLKEAGFIVLGPSQQAAQLEASKIFSKQFMIEQGIPTATHRAYHSYEEALEGLQSWNIDRGLVIKSDGLAGGKGVLICSDQAEAERSLFALMKDPDFSIHTDRILLERKLEGRELSAFALLDGESIRPLGYVCDYKRLKDGDLGPNTGGMGTFTPTDFPDEHQETIIHDIFHKVQAGMQQRGTPYQGVLFVGLMIDGSGSESEVNVLEFNIRLGDPETQALLPTLEDDLFLLLHATATGTLSNLPPCSEKRKQFAVHVVMASEGYPSLSKTDSPVLLGQEIQFPSHLPPMVELFFAGVREENGRMLNSGGRVLGVTARSSSLPEARSQAYQIVEQIQFRGSHFRSDIAKDCS